MSDDEEDRPRSTYKTPILTGADNYAKWELSVGSTLLGKGLLACIISSPPSSPAKEVQKYGKAFAIIIQSLSHVVQQSLSSAARSITAPNLQLLWDEVKGQYS